MALASMFARVDHAKLVAPSTSRRLARPRLVHLLASELGNAVTILSAGPGYGKSAALAELCDAQPGRIAFFRVDRADRDTTRFVAHLVAAIREVAPGFAEDLPGTPLRVAAVETKRGEVDTLSGILSDELTRLERPCLLVLDDFHLVQESAQIRKLIGYLIESGSPNIRFIIAARGPCQLPIARQKAYGAVSEIGNVELAFTREEARKLLLLHDVQVSDEELDTICERTLGWGAGLVMLAHSLKPRSVVERPQLLTNVAGSLPALYEFLADEVFARESAEIQQFLMHISVLGTLVPSVCDSVAQTNDAASKLEMLEMRGMFVIRAATPLPAFRFHPLFRDFLHAKLVGSESAATVRLLHQSAAEALEAIADCDNAIRHYCETSAYDEAVRVIESAGPEHLEAGLFDTVLHWLELLPEEALRSRPRLLAQKGRILHQQADYENALSVLTLAWELYDKGGDLAGMSAVGAELGLLHTRMGTNRAGADLLGGIVSDARIEPILRADMLRALSANLREIGETDTAARRGEDALAIVRSLPATARQARSHLRVARSLGVVYVVQGNVESAIGVLAQAVRSGRWSHENDIELSWSWSVLGTAHYCAGEFDAALEAFISAESLTGRHVATQREWIGLWRGCLHRDQGRFDLAESDFGEVGDKALADLALLRLRQNESDEALRLARVAHRARHRHELAIERARADVTLGIISAHRGLYEAAEQHFTEAESALEASGSHLRLLSLRLHRASAELDRGRFDSATRLIRQTLGAARMRGYRHFLWWDPFVLGKICAQALVMRIEMAYVRELALMRLGRSESVHFRPLLHASADPVRTEAMAILQGLAEERGIDSSTLDELFRPCDNPRTRTWLRKAVEAGTLSAAGVNKLRQRYGLTWKELEVFVMYYLSPALLGTKTGTNLRRSCAESLHISENTVRAHIKSIRLKLDLPGEAGTVAVGEWLQAAGISAH